MSLTKLMNVFVYTGPAGTEWRLVTRNAKLNCESFYVEWKGTSTPDNVLTLCQTGAFPLSPFFPGLALYPNPFK